MGLLPALLRYLCGAVVFLAVLSAVSAGHAQEGPRDLHASDQSSHGAKVQTRRPVRHAHARPYGGGSPLNVLLHTKLWETPPEAKKFVRANRRPTSKLHFMPTEGTPHKRPKLLSTQQLKMLEGELEEAGAHNEKAAGVKSDDFADARAYRGRRFKKRRWRARHKAGDMPIKLH